MGAVAALGVDSEAAEAAVDSGAEAWVGVVRPLSLSLLFFLLIFFCLPPPSSPVPPFFRSPLIPPSLPPSFSQATELHVTPVQADTQLVAR